MWRLHDKLPCSMEQCKFKDPDTSKYVPNSSGKRQCWLAARQFLLCRTRLVHAKCFVDFLFGLTHSSNLCEYNGHITNSLDLDETPSYGSICFYILELDSEGVTGTHSAWLQHKIYLEMLLHLICKTVSRKLRFKSRYSVLFRFK